MKVLKFGGTSVSSVETVKNISAILKRTTEKQIVVCSALSKVTNMLTEAGDKAAAGDISYREISAQIEKRHYDFIDALIEPSQQNDLKGKIHNYITRLDKVLESIYFLNELSERAYYIIVSFGERMSNDIIYRYLQIHNGNVDFLDSSQIIITRPVGGKEHVNRTVTYENIRKKLEPERRHHRGSGIHLQVRKRLRHYSWTRRQRLHSGSLCCCARRFDARDLD